LTNNCFEEQQLWGVASGNKFGKLLLETNLPWWSIFGEQFWEGGGALRGNFDQKL
jgi:hypothetical protein